MKAINLSIFKNKKIFSFIMSCFSYMAIMNALRVPRYDIFSYLLLGMIYFFYYKTNYEEKEKYKGLLIYAALFSFILILGNILYQNQSIKEVNFLSELICFKNIIFLIGDTGLFYTLFINIIPYLIKIKIIKKDNQINHIKVFLLTFFVIFLCHLPYFLAFYPANMTSDTISEFSYFIPHFHALSDHHPVLHYLFMSLPYHIGMQLFHNANSATALVTLTQMIIMSLIFAYTVLFLYKRNVRKEICFGVTLFYALIPLYAFYSTILWKDVLFSGFFLLFIIKIIEFYEKEKTSVFEAIYFILLSLLMLFFRNNAIYIYLIVFFFSFFSFRKKRKNLLFLFLLVIGVYFIIKGPIFDALSIQKPDTKEYIAIPLQQVGRMAFKEVKFKEEERKLIDKVMKVDILRKKYHPQTVDAIKFDQNYHAKVLDKNIGKYAKLYMRLVLKHPVVATEAYLTSTLGFYYPNVDYEPVTFQLYENPYHIYSSSKLPKKVVEKITKLKEREVPILSIIWSIGLCFFLLLLLSYIAYKKRGKRILYIFTPILGLWLTLMIATPLYIEMRYAYGAYTVLPLLTIYTLSLESQNKNNKKRSKKNEK